MISYQFPSDFRWGAATAAYQIEGAASEGGRKPSVWDTFSRTPGGTPSGDTGDVACDFYHRYESDIALMAGLGIKHFRFSIAWPRIVPEGRGSVNEAGLDFYKRMVDCLKKNGITPHATLMHWDTPQALEDKYGGWLGRDIAKDFSDYAAVCARRLGDRIQNWMTMNEIVCFTHSGYGTSRPYFAPGHVVSSQKEVWQTSHHALLGHGMAVQALRANSPVPCKVSLVDNSSVTVPLTESAADIQAAQKAFHDSNPNGCIVMPAMTGRYSDGFVKGNTAKGTMPDIQPGDLETIRQPLDSFGLNLYTGVWVRAADNEKGYEILNLPKGYLRMNTDWLWVLPEALYWGLRHIQSECGFKGELFIAENGCAAQDEVTPRGEVMDLDRILYLRTYLKQAHRAVSEGLPLKGYFLWSLMDNFEWASGYTQRFGIVWNSYDTQHRIPKASAKWYAECIKQNRVV
jgi:beta-glucosidase